jgi:hypothetical protein
MQKAFYPFLFAVVCIISASCTPYSIDVENSQSANSNAEELLDYHCNKEQEQDCKMTIREKQRVLLLEQDYQGALNLMPQLEKELLEKAMLERETFAEGMIVRDPLIDALREIRVTYVYLYIALGKDEEALQKIRGIELSIDTDPVLAYLDVHLKICVLERLNMVDKIIDEINTILDNPNVGFVLWTNFPLYYAKATSALLFAQIVKEDFESAKDN